MYIPCHLWRRSPLGCVPLGFDASPLVPLLRSPVPLFVPLWFPYVLDLGAGLGRGGACGPFAACAGMKKPHLVRVGLVGLCLGLAGDQDSAVVTGGAVDRYMASTTIDQPLAAKQGAALFGEVLKVGIETSLSYAADHFLFVAGEVRGIFDGDVNLCVFHR